MQSVMVQHKIVTHPDSDIVELKKQAAAEEEKKKTSQPTPQ
jgi:hypothetical protein